MDHHELEPEELLRLAKETNEALRDWDNKAPKMANTQEFGQAYHLAQDLVAKAESLLKLGHVPVEADAPVVYYFSDEILKRASKDFQAAALVMNSVVAEAAGLAEAIKRMQIPVALAHYNLMRLIETLEHKARFPEPR